MSEETGRLANLPVTLFGSVMGLAGLAIVYLRTEEILDLPLAGAGTGLLWLVSAWFVILLLGMIAKGLLHPFELKAEFNHPVKMNFFPAISISLLLLGIGWSHAQPGLARVLWWIGTPLQLAFLLKILSIWFHRDMHINTINPAWFIPVVGTLLIPVAGVNLTHVDISLFFFAVGLFFWLALFAIVLYRIFFHDPMPEKLLPTFFILIAPPAIGFIAALRLSGEAGLFQRGLYFLGLFTFLLMLSMVDRFRRLPFFVSWWAYTFPLDALTLSTLLMYRSTGLTFYRILAQVFLVLTTLVIALVLARTCIAASRREICVPE